MRTWEKQGGIHRRTGSYLGRRDTKVTSTFISTYFNMRYILSFILVFLLNLPNCGMVFAGMMNEGMGHSTSNDISMAASHENGDI